MIKGLFVDSEFGNLYLNDKWEFSKEAPISLSKYKLFHGRQDLEMKTFQIYAFKDSDIMAEDIKVIESEEELTPIYLKTSSPLYAKKFTKRKLVEVDKDDVVGMSLGQSIILLNGLYDIYRPAFVTLTLLHRILIGEEIWWFELESKNAFAFNLQSGDTQANEIEMGLVW